MLPALCPFGRDPPRSLIKGAQDGQQHEKVRVSLCAHRPFGRQVRIASWGVVHGRPCRATQCCARFTGGSMFAGVLVRISVCVRDVQMCVYCQAPILSLLLCC